MPKKKFINKNEAHTFRLMHRRQRDPLIASEEVGAHVMEAVETKSSKKREKYGIYHDDDYNYLQHLRDVNDVLPRLIGAREDDRDSMGDFGGDEDSRGQRRGSFWEDRPEMKSALANVCLYLCCALMAIR
uniref:Protein LTV1 homolog n=1 Tax=Steinernema glaseri TaxID=37863 RepID=A0A1I7Z4V4_9BILA